MPRIKKYIPFQNMRIELIREAPVRKYQVWNARGLYDAIHKEVSRLDRECFWVVPLTGKNHIIGINLVSMGSLTSSIIHAREVFKPAILTNAAGVILVHNHPSGDPTPSKEDKEVTKRLKDAGGILGIGMLKHIIIGDGEYYSFADECLLSGQ
ncbi:MAG: JAB domain-containing protein [Deltaproteobacteria bacterium]|nr:JAB domain-containing protein [Deltaproteobacteria bacterium]